MNLLRPLRRVRAIQDRVSSSPASRRALLGVSLVAFAVMGWFALRSFPDDVDQRRKWPLLIVVALVGPLATVAVNALEFRAQGRMLHQSVPGAEAVRITVLGTAANLLPLPGSVVVRTSVLARMGAGHRRAIASSTIVGLTWLSATTALAGVGLVAVRLYVVGGLVALAAVAGFGASVWLTARLGAGALGAFPQLIAIEFATALIGAGRLLGMVIALGLEITAGQAMALTLSGVLAAATGIFPSGIGIREAVAAGIASVVDLPAAVGFVATAADRIAGLVVLAALSLLMLVLRTNHVSIANDAKGATASHG